MKRFIAILSAVMLAPCSLVMAQDGPKDPTMPMTLLKYEPDSGERITVALTNAESASEYWVGLRVTIPEDAERKKLNVPKDQPSDAGLIVQEVVPDAPGDKAGIKVGDLLTKLGDKPLKSLSDPLDAIRDAKDSKLTLTFVRDGKVFEVVIKPAKRPSNFGLYGPEPPKEVAGPRVAPNKENLEGPGVHPRLLQGMREELYAISTGLQQIQKRVSLVERQLNELSAREAAGASSDRERLTRQIAAMKRAAVELADVGRTEDADRLKEEIRKLSEKMRALGQPDGAVAPPKGAVLPQPITGYTVGLSDLDAASATQRAIAFLQRTQTELPAAVPPEVRRAMVVQRSEPDGAAVADLRKQIEDLRREIKELRDTVSKSKAERN